MPLVLGLDAPEAVDAALVGGKGAALARMAASGLAVPPTLLLTTSAYEAFVEAGSLRPIIRQELGRKNQDDMRWEEIWDTSLRIRNRFLRAGIPGEIEDALAGFIPALRPFDTLAVRSSAPGEDSPGASFAGLHDSVIGARSLDDVLEAVRAVWASLWTDRALLYRNELGIDPDSSTMAVVIQPLIDGEASGVAFGAHPIRPELAAVEAVHGLNQGLVDGSVEPDRWSVDPSSLRIVEHSHPEKRARMIVSSGAPEVVPVRPDRPPLGDEDVVRVIQAVVEATELFGAPQDVEWTLAEGRLVYLQSRPITAGAGTEADQRSWYLSLTKSLATLEELRIRVEDELIPGMDREADELAAVSLDELDDPQLADEIDRRRTAHEKWVDLYWQEFIPLAHGIRLFGQFYNEVVRPEDPHEFIGLLRGTAMLGVRRNQTLAELASMIRDEPDLHRDLLKGGTGHPEFRRVLDGFLEQHGAAVYDKTACFEDRSRLIRFLLSMADDPPDRVGSEAGAAPELEQKFRSAVSEGRVELAERILDLGRASYRLRDDDNLHLARLESLVLEAVEEGRRRVEDPSSEDRPSTDPDAVFQALRHPNLVVEPKPTPRPLAVAEGIRARPRQLIGQPAGPGVATGPARVIDEVDDLFQVRRGDVLVCDAIDPNMTFVAPMVSAVVERRGGMLIHGAIIAREYGLPCVTGVPDVTLRISTGDRITVDGYLGIVTASSAAES